MHNICSAFFVNYAVFPSIHPIVHIPSYCTKQPVYFFAAKSLA